ncbi:extracellular solute-binding protein [Fundicoccus sp. Sow4_H7]|uniref:extracellular solute-binding protein n=1 Tax=Fundicoccus sp. Sow4_H7 TaxID=3438784 RepID=UPI003F911FD0
MFCVKKRIGISALVLSLAGTIGLNNSIILAQDEVEVAREGFPIVEETITMTMMGPGIGIAEWEDMPMLQVYEDMTNIDFEYITPPNSDFGTRFNLAFASGDLPDVFFGVGGDVFSSAIEVDYGEQGLLLPLEEMIEEYAPNLFALLEERPDIRKSITTNEGHIYTLPMISEEFNAPQVGAPMWFNKTWLDALGVEELPKTTEEMYDLLIRFRDEDPNGNGIADEIPITEGGMLRIRTAFAPAFGMKTWGIEENDGIVRFTPILDEARAYLQYMNRLYSEGLIDQEIFSQANEQKASKGENNLVGMFSEFNPQFFIQGEIMMHPMMHPLTSEWQETPLAPLSQGISRGAFAITKNNPYPEASLRWADYFYTEEGFTFLNHGPEGYLWVWEDEEGGNRILNPELGITVDEIEDVRGEITPDYGIAPPGRRITLPPIGGELTEFQEFTRNETQEKVVAFGEIPYPLTYLTTEEREVINSIETDLWTFLENSEAQFITGQMDINDDEVWANYVSTIENMNIEEFVRIHQDAYDRWNAE